jgi:hypothetical protein
MTTIRGPKDRAPFCPGCGLYPSTHHGEHRPDCTAEQISEQHALANIAAVFGPHLTPQSATELHPIIADRPGPQ